MSYDNYSARGRAPDRDESSLRAMLDAEDVHRRRDAAIGLVDVATDGFSEETRRSLARRIRTDPDAEVRQFAVEALGVTETYTPAIADALEDAEPWVRAEAIVAYSRTRPGDPATIRASLGDDSGWVRRNAVIALGKTGAASQDQLIERIKTDPHPPVREFAAQFLSADPTDTEEAVRILAAVLAREPNAFVRAKAAESLGELGTERAEEALETQGLGDRSENVQRTARRALAAARGEDPESIELPDRAPPGGGPEEPVAAVDGPEWTAHDSASTGRPGPDAGTHSGSDAGRFGGDRR